MGRYAQETGGGDFKQAPEGTHFARCIKLVDIGTQHGEYQGEPTARNQVIVQWELPNELMEIEGQQKPLIVSKFYTNSLSEKANLRKDLESWRAKAFTTEELMKFDLQKILGAPAMLTIVHNEKKKAQVKGVAALPKGTSIPPAFNPPDSFWIDEFDDNKFTGLPDGFRRLIAQSDEYKAAFTPPSEQREQDRASDGVDMDDIPF